MYTTAYLLFLVPYVGVTFGSVEIAQRGVSETRCEIGKPEGKHVLPGDECRSTFDCQILSSNARCLAQADDRCVCQVIEDGPEIQKAMLSLNDKRTTRNNMVLNKCKKGWKKKPKKRGKNRSHTGGKKGGKKAGGTRCKRRGGTCKDIHKETCNVGYVAGLCPGPWHKLCCLPTDKKNTCELKGGVCRNTKKWKCPSKFVKNLCPGPPHIKCCFGKSVCEQHGGECKDKTMTCPNKYVSGICPGAKNIQCCFNKNPCEQRGGKCQDKRNIKCNGKYAKGLCPGPWYNQCCFSKSVCRQHGGKCKDVRRKVCCTTYVKGLCPSSWFNQCCFGSSVCEQHGANARIKRLTRAVLHTSSTSVQAHLMYSAASVIVIVNGVEGNARIKMLTHAVTHM